MQKHNEWLFLAEQDLKLAKMVLKNSEESIILPAMFHTQQCAEKALKGYLVYKKDDVPRSHNLVILLKLCSFHDKDFNSLQTEAAELNPYVTKTRYPDDILTIPDKSTLEISIKQAEKILNFVTIRIN